MKSKPLKSAKEHGFSGFGMIGPDAVPEGKSAENQRIQQRFIRHFPAYPLPQEARS